MGTHGTIARIEGDTWRGRYVHWDGYPSALGVNVQRIIARDGVEVALRTILDEHTGWSSLDGQAEQTLPMGYDDGRFVAVPGYGIAYTLEQAAEDEWITPEGDTIGAVFAYVVNPGTGKVKAFERHYDPERWGPLVTDRGVMAQAAKVLAAAALIESRQH